MADQSEKTFNHEWLEHFLLEDLFPVNSSNAETEQGSRGEQQNYIPDKDDSVNPFQKVEEIVYQNGQLSCESHNQRSKRMKTAFTGDMTPLSHYPLPEEQVVLCSDHIPQVPTPLPIPQQQGKGNRFVSVTESASVDSNVHERRVVGPTVTLSSVGSKPLVSKRKLREYEQCGNKEDAKFKVEATEKQVDISAAPRRPRAEAHYLSERRRRCKINERMKALQELIPQSNKSDMVSLLDGTVEYLKLLQNQVQMMSSGYSIVARGMGMGMQPYLVKPPYHPPSSSNQSDPSLGHFGLQNPHPMQMHFTDLYHHYNLQAPPHQPQVHTVVQPSTSKGANGRQKQKLG